MSSENGSRRNSNYSGTTDEINTENSRASSIKISIKNNLQSSQNSVEVPQESEDRINESKI